jgi:DHA3 family macrolide efflux protein-like MFS transporter
MGKKRYSLFKEMRIFTIIWGGQLISTLGSGLTSFALGVWVYTETGSPTLFAVNLLLWTVPNVLLSPVAGVVADRWDRRLVMIFSDTGAGLSSLFVLVILLTGKLEIWQVYLATFFNSAFGAFQWPAYASATSLLVPKEQLGRAGGMTEIGHAISHLASPVIAGALFVSVGLPAIIMIDVLTYIVALITLIAIRFPQPKETQEGMEGKGSFWKEAVFGWKYIRQRPGLFGLLSVFASLNFLFSAVYLLLVPMLLDMTTADVVGLVNSISGLGMLIGTLVMSAWGGPKRRIYGIFGTEVLAGLSLMVLGLRPSIPLIAAAGFGSMIGMPISNGCSQAIWQSKVAPDVQGRVFAIRSMIAFSIEPVAYAVAGPLAEKVFEPLMAQGGGLAGVFGPAIGVGPGRGIGLMFVIAGFLYVAASSIILIHSRIRRVELEIPDAIE